MLVSIVFIVIFTRFVISWVRFTRHLSLIMSSLRKWKCFHVQKFLLKTQIKKFFKHYFRLFKHKWKFSSAWRISFYEIKFDRSKKIICHIGWNILCFYFKIIISDIKKVVHLRKREYKHFFDDWYSISVNFLLSVVTALRFLYLITL